MPHALYVADLDFTLLDADSQLSDTTRAALHRWLDEGLAFTVASARAHVSIREVLRGLPLRLPIITMNGACITDFASGEHLHTAHHAPEQATSLLAWLDEAGYNPLVASTTGKRDRLRFGPLSNPAITAYYSDRLARGDTRLRPGEDRRAALEEQVLSFTVIADPALAAALVADLEARFKGLAHWTHMTATLHSDFHWVTITAPEADKGQALTRLRRLCKLEDRPLVVYGDDVQDIPMLALADIAVAMANARKPVRAAAHETAGHHTEDGVIRHLAARLQRGRRGV